MKKIILFLGLLILLGSGWYFFYQYKPNKKSVVQEKITVYLKVTGQKVFNKQEIAKGKTALDLTKEKEDIVTKGDGANAYIIGINGIEAKSADKEYWAFYVNAKMATVGAGSYKLKPGDKIEWKIEKY
ncbi:MAG: hypothetical protein US40_C0003G0022 [Candidatus Roizmanbacteria bacterium GW2011_GWC2_37_13]|uniref:Transcobalamin-like C-terminal domain-containing protein n=1 Tax=Candidatus Roizmanbacteria bacterium GW2011_GWC2_37_13 TaxID=1618486 RepID=A0A0G0GJ79_9BACT|nr:MAG: hypothetical protein US38_C0004G0024 [Candidatus Roizmanbacteria bacterium GW2011_GWC1_37_12]KKQ26170.1 MAG: hypothetical protein US40_C0003G0022 [Candidatus Roizmanbacteria bacterium GW2011_GWC2_37_13]